MSEPFGTVLIVDDEQSMRHSLGLILKKNGYDVIAAEDGDVAMKVLEKERVDYVLCDIRMPRKNGLDVLDEAMAKGVEAPIVMMTAYGAIDQAVEAMKKGAYDYISKPFKPDEILLVLRRAREHEDLVRDNIELRRKVRGVQSYGEFITKNEKMAQTLASIRKIASFKTTVLITGESGTGKELVARMIHVNSDRAEGPFVAINCGAIPPSLLESELFGYKAGSFTDARTDKAGLFEAGTNGTLFLDEIGELPLQLQVKLLRVLQEQEVRRIGENKSRPVNVRVIAATAKDLEKEAAAGRFREDLLYRINVFPIRLIPLRDRPEDVEPLSEHFIGRFNRRMNLKCKGIRKRALALLMEHPWPGNVRELENAIERAMILCEIDYIDMEHLPEKIRKPDPHAPEPTGTLSIKKQVRALEREMIVRALKATKGNKTQAAKLLEISPRTLLYKLEEYKIEE